MATEQGSAACGGDAEPNLSTRRPGVTRGRRAPRKAARRTRKRPGTQEAHERRGFSQQLPPLGSLASWEEEAPPVPQAGPSRGQSKAGKPRGSLERARQQAAPAGCGPALLPPPAERLSARAKPGGEDRRAPPPARAASPRSFRARAPAEGAGAASAASQRLRGWFRTGRGLPGPSVAPPPHSSAQGGEAGRPAAASARLVAQPPAPLSSSGGGGRGSRASFPKGPPPCTTQQL